MHLDASAVDARMEEHRLALDALIARILRYGRAMNLSGARSADALEAHVREAVAGVLCVETLFGRRLSAGERWLDVGSGGGLPGLVVAVCSAASLTLVEPRAKRASFLESSAAVLGRRDAVVQRVRMEASAWADLVEPASIPGPGHWDVMTARAVWAPELWGEYAASWLNPEGVAVFHVQAGTQLPAGWSAGCRSRVGGWSVVAAKRPG